MAVLLISSLKVLDVIKFAPNNRNNAVPGIGNNIINKIHNMSADK